VTAIESAPALDRGAAVRPATLRARIGLAAKRALDVAGAAVLLLAVLPLLLVLAVAIKLESPGPVIFRCRRVGHRGRELGMWKLRKMRDGVRGPSLTVADDDRFTRIGRALAVTKLDEIPQLWNVLRGEMSLVGPRPETEDFVALHPEAYAAILEARPGITGLSQLAFAHESRILDPADREGDYVRRILPQKIALDQLYAAQRSLRRDLAILVWTLLATVLRQEVAVNRATGRPSRRAGRARRRAAASWPSTRIAPQAPERPAELQDEPTRAIILAGGRGTRLAPYTSVLPKPLMPIGERAILEIVVERLADEGLTDITFCVGYLSHLIRAVFDNRRDPRASIAYVQEESALGTAGPLLLVPELDDTFLVMNGDVLTTLDFRELVRHHRRHGNVVTIATFRRTVKIDYGVLYVHRDGDGPSGQRVQAYEEKPEICSTVSMGVYVIEPRALGYIPPGTYFDFPDLVQALLSAGERVGSYAYDGLWFDIGRHDDYERAVAVWTDSPQPVARNGEVVRT
jgi:lipopolysaccharide/colanic/teichoic acid biosynthesis glycosyltransferase/dTDP-glucose pyrophosphorylase